MKPISVLALFYTIAQAALMECQNEWEIAFKNQNEEDLLSKYSKMIAFSGFEVDSFGNYHKCISSPDLQYTIIRLTDTPTKLFTLCSPKLCDIKDYYEILQHNSSMSKYKINQVIHSQVNKFPPDNLAVWISKEFNDMHTDYFAIIMIIFISLIIAIALYASIKDYQLANIKNEEAAALKYLLCFSLLNNLKLLLRSRSRDKLGQKDSLELLNFLRVFGNAWIIIFHTISSMWVGGVISNTKKFTADISPKNMIVIDATFAVDIFFWISGFLLGFLLLSELHKANKLNWKMVYVHRILRYLPLNIFMVCFVMSIWKYVGGGPLWSVGDFIFEECKGVWWSNIFFISNFIPNWRGNYCLGPSWSTSADMQFFIITVPIIYIYTKNRKIGWLCLISYVLISIISSGYIAYTMNINAVNAAHGNYNNWAFYYYNKTYCRIAPYAIGTLTAFIVFSYRKNRENGSHYDKFAISIAKALEIKFWRYSLATIGIFINVLVLLGPYDTYRFPGKHNEYLYWSKWQNVAYIALSKPLFGLAISFIFMPAFLGHFKILTKILSFNVWAPLERLTFCVYLIHYLVMLYFYRQQIEPYIISEESLIANFLYFLLVSYILAVPLATLIEMPFNLLEKVYFSKETAQALTNKKRE